MSDLKINFSVSPWLLLLIIPLVAIAFFVYFRTKKRFRRSRNRVISLILHCMLSVTCVLLLSGINFYYEKPNVQNELVILVDASYSSGSYKERVDSFVHDVLVTNDNRSKVSIVKFGYDQRLVLPMGEYDPEEAYESFLASQDPDVTATDISGALTYVWDPVNGKSGGEGEAIIHYPETAKILLISDGLETDRSAMNVVKKITMDGVQIDTSFYPATFFSDVWITGVTYPDRKYTIGETVNFQLALRSSIQGKVDIAFTDKGDFGEESLSRDNVSLILGAQTITFPYAFTTPGYHELKFTISSERDSLTQNNVYYLYYEIDEYTSILIVERYDGESQQLVDSLSVSVDATYISFNVVNITDDSRMPKDIDTLLRYDEVILVNIAHGDMPDGFEELLESYVSTYGGGLFTVGGVERDQNGNVVMEQNASGQMVPKAHSYNKDDMNGTTFQSMLPVDAINYTPPVALAIIIDRSGSMDTGSSNSSALDIAIKGAIDALDALSPRDQVGVMVLEDTYRVGLDMTPMTQKASIISSIRHVADGGGGGTKYAPAIEMACQTLITLQNAEKKHILLLSDGQPGDSFDVYNAVMQHYYETYGITITYVSVGAGIDDEIDQFVKNGGGHAYSLNSSDIDTLSDKLESDLGLEELSGAIPYDYYPQIFNHTTVVDGIHQSDLDKIRMGGFFTTAAKSYGEVEVALMAEYVPLYAQWKYGAGKVGSFLCDLSGYWSQAFLDSESGGTIIYNAVSNLISKMTTTENHAFSATIIEDNYRTQVSIYGFNGQEEGNSKLVAIVREPDKSVLTKFDLSNLSIGGNRFTFENLTPGIYEIVIIKVPMSFNIFSADINSIHDIPASQIQGSFTAYRAFSYSKEYDAGLDSFKTGRDLLVGMSTREIEEGGNPTDKLVYDAETLLSDFAAVHVTYDPQLLLAILALVLLLLDIAVRKFKFLWPHEIIKTYKQRKAQFGS